MKQLDSFKKAQKPQKRVSSLKKYETEIKELFDENYTVEQIQEYLSSVNVEVSTRRIYQFINRNFKKNLSQNFSLKTPSTAAAQNSVRETVEKVEVVEKNMATQIYLEKWTNKKRKEKC